VQWKKRSIQSICFQKINDLQYFWVSASNMADCTLYDELGNSLKVLTEGKCSVYLKQTTTMYYKTRSSYIQRRSKYTLHSQGFPEVFIADLAPMRVHPDMAGSLLDWCTPKKTKEQLCDLMIQANVFIT
jgi:hypothetical protein